MSEKKIFIVSHFALERHLTREIRKKKIKLPRAQDRYLSVP